MAAIRLEGVTKRYQDGTLAVAALDLEIDDGELMVLVGPSGSGKSTALRMIAGLEEITDGELAIGDEIVNERAAKDRDIAMVFQNYALYPHMTVRENMGFALRMARTPKAEADRRIEAAASLLDLTDQLERRPSRLSGGQRQRVAMGRAIVREPAAFLMDEPLSNLDAKLRVQMRTEIARIQQRLGTTTVYVTHDQVEAMTLGRRVAVMRAGRLEQVGTPQELYERPANRFVAGFIGSPAMNFLPGRIEHDALRLPFGVVPLPAGLRPEAGRDVLVGARPEHFGDGADAPGLRFRARIDVVESLGSEVHAHFPVAGDHQVVARLAGRSELRAGAHAELVLDPSRLRLFDPVTERSLLDDRVAA